MRALNGASILRLVRDSNDATTLLRPIRNIAFAFLLTTLVARLAHSADSTAATQPADRTAPRSGATTQPADAHGPRDVPTSAVAAPRGPQYLNLRYDEDFRYLDGPPGSFTPDLFDPIKNIHLGDDWRLTLGGSVRVRIESETNRAFGATEPAQDTYVLHRQLIHADLWYRRTFRVFAEGINVMLEDRNLPPQGNMRNQFDVNQLFFDLKFLGESAPLTLRFGRQELSYGRHRTIHTRTWGMVRRRFDGLKIMYASSVFDLDFFLTKPVREDLPAGYPRKPDHYREEETFYGFYGSYKGIRDHVVDVYWLIDDDVGELTAASGRVGDKNDHTIGARFGGKHGPWDYDAEAAIQLGKIAGDRVAAWFASAEAGYTFLPVSWKPRLGLGFDFGSGDDDPTDGRQETYDQLFPSGHSFYGHLDLFGRANMIASNVNVTVRPHERVKVQSWWYTFWNNTPDDALYGTGGNPFVRDPTGTAGHDVGNELDVAVTIDLDVHSSLLLGYAHFWGTNFIRAATPDRDADLIYFQYQFRF